MAIQIINIGSFANDGTGDDLRVAFEKVNANFAELNLTRGQNNTASNVGTGAGVYKEKIGVDLRLRSLKAGSGITISTPTVSDTEITITNNRNNFSTLVADSGSIVAASGTASASILGGIGITTSVVGGNLVITNDYSNYDLATDLSPTLAANLDANNFDIINVDNITANNVDSLVYGIDIRNINSNINIFDFGNFIGSYSNLLAWLLATSPYGDMGTFSLPSEYGIDGGVLT